VRRGGKLTSENPAAGKKSKQLGGENIEILSNPRVTLVKWEKSNQREKGDRNVRRPNERVDRKGSR